MAAHKQGFSPVTFHNMLSHTLCGGIKILVGTLQIYFVEKGLRWKENPDIFALASRVKKLCLFLQ